MTYSRGSAQARPSSWRSSVTATFISVAALTALCIAVVISNVPPEHQRANEVDKADPLVNLAELRAKSKVKVALDHSEIRSLKVHRRDIAGFDEPTTMQAPISNTGLFEADQSCLAPEKVLDQMQADQKTMGGKVVMLTDGLQQPFSDIWRLKAHAAPVRVSNVVAHLFWSPAEDEWNADVIEFDVKGCAMSRTLLSGDAWNGLLEAVRGGQA